MEAESAPHPEARLSPTAEASKQQPPKASRSSRRHRRTASEDLGRTYEQGLGFYKNPPTQISYNPNFSPKNDGTPGLPSPQAGHNRIRSWSGNYPYPGLPGYSPFPGAPGLIPPHPSFSPAGNPLIPMTIDPSQNGALMLPPHQVQYSRSQRKRKDAGHRRVHSYSGVPSYGSFGGDIPPAPTAHPPPVPSGRNIEFSPRSEIMKLTAGLRPSSGSSSPRPSPNKSYRGVPASPRQSSLRGNVPFPRPDDARVSFSPGTPLAGDLDNGGSLGAYSMEGGHAPNVPLTDPGPTGINRHTDVGGEAVFLAQNKTKHRKAPSSRKMHMRQRSAQLFMEDVKGVEQLPACRDLVFFMVFVFHLLGIVYLGNIYGYQALRYHDEMDSETSVTIIYSNVVYVACLSGIFAVTISALALLLMTIVAKKIVQIALILTITLSFAWGTIGIGLSPKKVVPATGIIALALSVAYTFIVWDRIPFAAANLNAGLQGIRSNPGAIYIAFFFQFLALGWSIYYAYVVVGVYDALEVGDIGLYFRSMKAVVYFGLGISYYWTLHVFLNIVQVTVAGVIGGWWFTRDGDSSSRRADLIRAFFRSSFYAIGSICYGSLLVGPVRLLRQLSALFRPSQEVSSLMCLHECIYCIQSCLTSCVDSLADRFNPWSFTYVGLYGYDLVEAGLHATELFDKRGWSTIVSDDLVPNVLLMTSLVVGGITGCVAHLIENIESLSLTSLDEPLATSFLVGMLVGLMVSSVLFGVINSSVHAVIVCFAANPVDFEQNHPKLSQEMRTAWREVWPGCMDVVDMRVAVATYLDPSANGCSEQQPLLA